MLPFDIFSSRILLSPDTARGTRWGWLLGSCLGCCLGQGEDPFPALCLVANPRVHQLIPKPGHIGIAITMADMSYIEITLMWDNMSHIEITQVCADMYRNSVDMGWHVTCRKLGTQTYNILTNTKWIDTFLDPEVKSLYS